MSEFQTYEITNVMPTGEESPTYGTEYHIKFAESADTFKLWAKKPYEEGQKVEGNIVDGKFKKYKKPYTPGSAPKNASQGSSGAYKGKSSDGQRQGMCINNAANYVNATQGDKLEANDWANMVHAFAQALYTKGDLTTDTEVTDQVANVKNVFGI